MKTKILAELKKKFPGLSNEFLGFVAAKLEAKVTEETQIEGAITELDTILPIKDQADFFQSESDRRVTAAKLKFEQDHPKPPTPPAPPAPPAPDPDKPQDFTAQFKELADKLAAFEKKENQSKLTESFQKKLAEKKIPLKFAKGRTIESEDQLETLLAEVEADYAEVKQEMANEGLAEGTPPKGGQRNTSKLASKEEVDDVINKIV